MCCCFGKKCKIDETTPRAQKAKRCLRICSFGEVNNGLYFKNTQKYLSATSGICTIIGLLVVFGLSINVFIGIF
jgi:hypothetical protein